ncbi:hypothetical protein KC340_g9726 [Hortaea werneckii]|nr:hypothetical protein KC342_g8970 [Hortaea werneckii]KAI7097948.1 hypothetical protein KC339_g9335 [Hortaea werneckii]KAI7214918.1 hypothetical protein KC365_g13753 [Hortaea werneckii]KAI7312868.1 hypothetical protein KC340_g9726 [Hortaea werneckii]KAI7384131.1 hypothetical protein KC328_g10961 [Hortaea werneckii]
MQLFYQTVLGLLALASTVLGHGKPESYNQALFRRQIFFDQDPLTAINANWPYTQDTTDLTLNADDHVITGQQNTIWYDPFVELCTIGYNVNAGFLGYINFAIDPTAEPADAASGSGGGMGEDMPSVQLWALAQVCLLALLFLKPELGHDES